MPLTLKIELDMFDKYPAMNMSIKDWIADCPYLDTVRFRQLLYVFGGELVVDALGPDEVFKHLMRLPTCELIPRPSVQIRLMKGPLSVLSPDKKRALMAHWCKHCHNRWVSGSLQETAAEWGEGTLALWLAASEDQQSRHISWKQRAKGV